MHLLSICDLPKDLFELSCGCLNSKERLEDVSAKLVFKSMSCLVFPKVPPIVYASLSSIFHLFSNSTINEKQDKMATYSEISHPIFLSLFQNPDNR